eukprot:SAG22_NODE_261_length_13373_cov_17.745472_3_plen_515_part_00
MPCDLIMLDEAQDLRPTFCAALRHVLRAADPGGVESLQMALVGDPKQLLYDFDSYGDDKASAQYLERPADFFGEHTLGRDWKHLQLSESYRLTPSIAEFVNVLWGTQIRGGSKAEDLPVEYLCRNAYPPKDSELDKDDRLKPAGMGPPVHSSKHISTKVLAELLDTYGPENVMFLAQSVKSEKSPIRRHVNILAKLKDEHGQRRFNFDIKEHTRGFEGKPCLENKTRVWTFCSSKGCEADAVVVFGAELGSVQFLASTNQMGVALSRAKKKLVVVHSRKWSPEARSYEAVDYYPAGGASGLDLTGDGAIQELQARSKVTRQAVEGLAELGKILPKLASDIPGRVQSLSADSNAEMDIVYEATSFTHFSAVAEERFLAFGNWSVEVDAGHLPRIDYNVEVRFNQTTEDVSALYGQALTLMLQHERDGFCPQIEAVLFGGVVCFDPNGEATVRNFHCLSLCSSACACGSTSLTEDCFVQCRTIYRCSKINSKTLTVSRRTTRTFCSKQCSKTRMAR